MLLRALAVLCPWDAQKVTFWERRNIRFCADDHHIFFDVRTADDVRCARREQTLVAPLAIVRYAAPKLRLHRF